MRKLFTAAFTIVVSFGVGSQAFAGEGEQLYQQRCAPCHDTGQAGVPPRAQLASRSSEFIAEKLLLGSMQAQTLGLSEAQIALIADYLARQPVREARNECR
jgi:mono/diheme cytochrome c family protein